MDVLVTKFLAAFQHTSHQDYQMLINFLQSRLVPQYTKEADIIRQIDKALAVDDQQRLASMIRQLDTTQIKFKANILYIFQQLQRFRQEQTQSIRIVDFDFNTLLRPAMSITQAPVEQISPATFEQLDTSVPENYRNEAKQQGMRCPTTPTARQYAQDILYTVQGLHGVFLKYDIDLKTGNLILVPRLPTIQFYSQQLAFLPEFQRLGNLYVRLNKCLKEHFASAKSCTYKRQFNQFCNHVVQTRFLNIINHVQRNLGGYSYVALRNKVRQKLLPTISFLHAVASYIVSMSLFNVQLLYQITQFQYMNKDLYDMCVQFLQQILKDQVRRLIFDQLGSNEAFFLNITQSPDFTSLSGVVTVDDVILRAAGEQVMEELQVGALQQVVYNLQYIRLQLKKFIDFESFREKDAISAQLDDNRVSFSKINLSPVIQFTNNLINQHLISKSLILQQIVLITNSLFGLKSDFMTQFVLVNQGLQSGDLYQIQCDNELEYLIDSSIIQNNPVLNSLQPNELKVLKGRFSSLIVKQKREFYMQFKSQDLKIVFSETVEKQMVEIFKICYQLRKTEIYLSQQVKELNKQVRNKKHQFVMFKLMQMCQILSNYMQMLLQGYRKLILETFNEVDANYIKDLKSKFQTFSQGVEKQIIFDGLVFKVLDQNYQLIIQYCSQMKNYCEQLAIQNNNQTILSQQKSLIDIFNKQIMTNFGIFMMEARKTKEDQMEALVERFESVCF